MTYARHAFALARDAGDGQSVAAHLARAERFGRKATRQADEPECPEGMLALWHAFADLDRWRGAGGMGPSPLTLHDLAAYEARFGVRFAPFEVDLLKRLDHERLAALLPKAKAPE